MELVLSILMCMMNAFSETKTQEVSFEVQKIKVGQSELTVELAVSAKQQELGLMYRKTLGQDRGMLFVFSEERVLNFWMKNTFVPLSIGFFDRNKKLIEFFDMDPVLSELQVKIPSYTSKKPARYALEVNKGWFKDNNIKIGDSLSSPGLK